MSRRCSECGLVGHNRRNRMCRLNAVSQSVPSIPITPVNNGTELELDHSLVLIEDTIIRWEQRDLGTRQFMSVVVPMITQACIIMTNVMSHSIDVSEYFERLRRYAVSVNQIVYRFARGIFVIRVNITQGGVFSEVIESQPSVYIVPRQVAIGLPQPSYFKAVSLTMAPSVACQCPICFEEVSAEASVYTACGHGFCGVCIKELSEKCNKKPSCPMCRREIKELMIGSQETLNDIKSHISCL